jgi:C4-dicarboxylate transporter DctM subunit
MFLAGVLPGILIAVCLMAYCFLYCKRHGEDRQRINSNYTRLHEKGFWSILKESFWALLTPVIILGGIYGGIATPTEVSAVSVVYAAIVSIFIYKDLKVREITACLKEAIASTAPAMLVVGMAVVFGKILALMQIPQMVATGLTSAFSSRVVIILVMNLILLVFGMLMDTVSCIMILTPIFVPIANAINMNLVHLGIIMVVNLAIGFVTPPVGANLYVGSSMTGIPVLSIARKSIPMLIFFFLALLIITFVPQVSLVLLG